MWYVNAQGLISFAAWEQTINDLKAHVHAGNITDEKQAVALMQKELACALKDNLPKSKHICVAFSGGMDSTLLAYLLKEEGIDFTAVSIGFAGSKDVAQSIKIAQDLGCKHVIKEFDLRAYDALLKETAQLLKGHVDLDVVSLGVGAVTLALCKECKRLGLDVVYTGLGSEEIFAGYQRHEQAENIDEECWRGLVQMYHRDLMRDVPLLMHHQLTGCTPLLDTSLIANAMGIDASLKIKDGFKKYILAEASVALGVPREFAFRKKLGAQYGSNFIKAMDKLTKLKGYSKKAEYIEQLKS